MAPEKFGTRDEGFEVGMSPNCRTFHDGMMMMRANGPSLKTKPLRAARSLVKKCAPRSSATIGLKDGNRIEVKCSTLTPVAAYFYDLDNVWATHLKNLATESPTLTGPPRRSSALLS